MTFQRLDSEKILTTAQALERRVLARFPDRGLARVAREIVTLTKHAKAESQALHPPIWWLRFLIGALILGGAILFLFVGSFIPLNAISKGAVDSVESIEAAINTAVLAGLGLIALGRIETRIKRRRVAESLHGLRSVIHVIDMHQLTKDPVVLTAGYQPTPESPDHALTANDLARYLDYCSEMLAITGKLAALYAQAVNDEGVAQAVNDIESLGSNLSRKIWQKITMIESGLNRRG